MLLNTQVAFRTVANLPFCYLCANDFGTTDEIDRDHVPNSALFAKEDRQPALILRSHVACNHGRSEQDELITQLVGVLRGRPMQRRARRPKIVSGSLGDGLKAVGVRALPLQDIIFRWVAGFHAALYREPLGPSSHLTCPPLPEGKVVEGQLQTVEVPEIVPKLVEAIRRNRAAKTIDAIECRNGKCRYECVWERSDDGRRMCVWALDIYGWHRLGDWEHFEPRGCVGIYRPNDERVPSGASLGTQLIITANGPNRLVPFD